MDWMQMLGTFGWLFCCVGMVQQQQEMTFKQKFNLAINLCNFHQRAIVVLLREGMGRNFLGVPCVIAFVMMILWTGFTQDALMLYWLIFWTLCHLWRSFEANRLRGQINSHSDGRCIGLGSNERLAKGFFEPLLVGVLGVFLRFWYLENGWSPAGLPNFFLLGFITLSAVQKSNVMMYERKLDAIGDAKMEQKDLVREYRDRYGN